MTLADYVINHVQRGACLCGKCIDAPNEPELEQPSGHTADLVFFKVSAQNAPDAKTLRELCEQHKGDFCDIDLFDGKGHDYMEIGGFIGDQGLAMMLMGLGSLLGIWKLFTPKTLFGKSIPDDIALQLAGQGLIGVFA